MKEGKTISKFQPSSPSMMVAKVKLENGYHYESGLGRNAQGLGRLPDLIENKDCFCLGYKPSKKDKRRIAHEKKDKRINTLIRFMLARQMLTLTIRRLLSFL